MGQLHEGVRLQIEKRNKLYSYKTNKRRKQVVFQLNDWVWVHMHEEWFSNHGKSKLQPRGDVIFQVLERINNNAYKVDLLGKYSVSVTFNVNDLTLFDTCFDSRSNTFKERGDDVDHLMNTKDPLRVPNGPITRSKMKTFEEALNTLVVDVSAKVELGDHLKHQEEVWVHLIHVK